MLDRFRSLRLARSAAEPVAPPAADAVEAPEVVAPAESPPRRSRPWRRLPLPRVWPWRRRRLHVPRGTADGVAVLALLGFLLLMQRNWLSERVIPVNEDTPLFYFPVSSALREALAAGRLPLWEPRIFAGFPLLAEGQTGALFPLNWLLFGWLGLADGLIWQALARNALAALGMYLFCRAIRLSPLAALTGALIFPFAGFMIGQAPVLNSAHGTAMAPWILAGFEWALRARGWRRGLAILLGAMAVAGAALAVYPQIMLFDLLLLAFWGAFRFLFPPEIDGRPLVRWRRPRFARPNWRPLARATGAWLWCALRRGTRTILVGVAVGGLGLALAAPQLLPLLELGSVSGRAGGVTYEFASSLSTAPMVALTGFVFPRLLGASHTTFYVGTVSLVLALIAVVGRRDRFALFFGLVAVLATLTLFGPLGPVNLHYWLWQLPGFNQMRAPIRFAFLNDFALAVLAALGLQWARANFQRGLAHAGRARAGVVAGVLLVLAAAAPWLVDSARDWLANNKTAGEALSSDWFLDPTYYKTLLENLRLTDYDLRLAVLFLGLAAGLLLFWLLFGRWLRLWALLLVLLVAANSAQFGIDARQGIPYTRIEHGQVEAYGLVMFDRPNLPLAPSGLPYSVDFLRQNLGPYRALSGTVAFTAPDRLLGFNLADATGYSPLQPTRHAQYVSVAKRESNGLLDLLGVRYVVSDHFFGLTDYSKDVAFDLGTALAQVPDINPQETLVLPDTRATELRLAAVLRGGSERRQGDIVARVVLTDDQGREHRYPIRAGIEVSDMLVDQGTAKHNAVEAIPAGDQPLFLGRIALPGPDAQPFAVRQLRFERGDYGPGRLDVYGAALLRDDGPAIQVRVPLALRFANSVAYKDSLAVIWENPNPLSRAILVPRAERLDDPIAALARMSQASFDPRGIALVEGAAPELPTDNLSVVGTTRFVVDQPERLEIAVEVDKPAVLLVADSYYPGWEATVDGQPVPVRRADSLFRAVGVPAGSHVVRMTFNSQSFQTGLTLSKATGVALGALVVLPPLWTLTVWLGPRAGRRWPRRWRFWTRFRRPRRLRWPWRRRAPVVSSAATEPESGEAASVDALDISRAEASRAPELGPAEPGTTAERQSEPPGDRDTAGGESTAPPASLEAPSTEGAAAENSAAETPIPAEAAEGSLAGAPTAEPRAADNQEPAADTPDRAEKKD